MAGCTRCRIWGKVQLVAVGLLIGLGLLGCGKQGGEPDKPAAEAPAASGESAGPVSKPPAGDPRLQQSFAEAALTEPPTDWQKLPDQTLTQKSVGKLYTEVVRLWDGIHFVTSEGKPLTYTATLDTELGPIEITLRPDVAPNHVRSFVALARAGYYDGLVFQRIIHQKSEARPDEQVDLIEAGCPMGTGEFGFGSIGYWLKPEFSSEVHHEEGTVGAWHGDEPNTAACKFYITLCKAPFMDGGYTVFGKVTHGLDIARKISEQPVGPDPVTLEEDHPKQPVVIKKVTIHTAE
jgi:cyclophilin family peptidyl-prolyl cis-trans isomerase